jgi:nucleoside-diphosphate-sugar epimerase
VSSPRVLVTGAAGFVGRHCLRPLADRGYEVHAVSHTGRRAGIAEWHSADLLDPAARRRLLAEVAPTHLLHAAWYLEPGRYTGSAVNADWVVASLDLVRRFQEAGGTRVVAVGSCFEYEFGPVPFHEASTLRPATVYGSCKVALSTALEALSAATGLSSAWARLFYLYGPFEDRRRLIADITTSLLEGREVATSEGTQRRDYMFVVDTGDALAAVLDSEVTGAVNVATGEAQPVRDLVELVGEATGRQQLVRFGERPLPAGEPDEIRADIGRLTHEVGWHAVTPMRDAVTKTVKWWAAQRRDDAA